MMIPDSRSHGKLRIYLGAAPGVGKTYAMLREGHRLKNDGHDVVIGLVETHKRAETEDQIGDLEVVPRRVSEHGGVDMAELDVPAILRRHPEIVLIDELAHTNAPGSARKKRWQDVRVILDADISVIGTLNIQHIEGLNNIVGSITGVEVRETVPDQFLEMADDVQLIDLTVDALLERMEQGRIYPPAQAQQAMQHFFRAGNLTALRELALRQTAAGVDERLESYMREHEIPDVWPTSERVVVWVKPGQDAKTLIRRGWRIAGALHGELVVAIAEQADTAKIHHLAEDLGCEIRTVHSNDIAAIAELVRIENANILVVGHTATAKKGVLSRFSKTPVDELCSALENVDIYLVEL